MSIDTIALLDVTKPDLTPELLLETLAADSQFAIELIERFRPAWLPQECGFDGRPAAGDGTILRPGGFALRWQGRILDVYHVMRFGTFIGDAWCRDALREACRHLATLTGSGAVLYTHELMPHRGANLQEIAEWLRSHIGASARDFSGMRTADDFGSGAWYLEELGRLGSRPGD